ncbi:isoaspartyl peptidase/L-asparaginase family protein [Sphingomonas sp. HT-1]|uniref:isoaspartyl peptidase/L-asparaginase family protein n=1 Tax=unclassified Sphingomonas TaxID=196159 RepID=UPI0002FA819D|nr:MULTISPECIES: isoaspartyl peptidase/L-asparaginase family protein [unclassified Sphingomonas]KTF67605.1 asparaginase [Sphingomonas sp. WG]
MSEAARWAIIVHGGAKTIDPALHDRNRKGCAAAGRAGADVLRVGGSAVAAAEAAVRVLEDDPVFNAGFGSVRTSDGTVEMDAAMMEGSSLAIGGVAGVRRVRNPIGVARAMLPDQPVLLAGEGAERFAAAHGIALVEPETMLSRETLASENSKAHDTVGCVAIDATGAIAAATSTGGLPGKHPGRIGDSPVPGAGLYADDTLGGCAFSGDGEAILRTMLAAHVMHALETGGTAHEAAEHAIARLGRVGGEAGAIVVDRSGAFGIAHNSDHFALALHSSELDAPRAAVHRDELKDILHG